MPTARSGPWWTGSRSDRANSGSWIATSWPSRILGAWPSISTEGGGDQQVLQPTLVVAVPVEAFGRTTPAAVLPGRSRVPWREVPQQCPGAAMQSAGPERAVQMLAVVEVPVHPPHLAVEHVAGAVPAGVQVRDRPSPRRATQILDLLQDNPRDVPGRPAPQRPEPLAEASAVRRVIRLPDPAGDLCEHPLQVLGSVTDLEPGVQEALEDDHTPEQGLPGRLRRLPAVGVERLGSVLWGDVAGLGLEDPVGGLQVVGPRRLGRLGPQTAPRADSRGNVDLLAIERLVMLIGQQVLGQPCPTDGRPHDTEASEAAFQAIPEHRVVAEDAGQGPERHAELAEEQGAFDVLNTRGHVGHEERRPDAVGRPVFQEDASDRQPLLDRDTIVLQFVAPGEARREHLGYPPERVVERTPELAGIVDDLPIDSFRDGQAERTMPP